MKYLKTIFIALLAFSLAGCDAAKQILDSSQIGGGGLTSREVAMGLKEALQVGTDSATSKLSRTNGFFGNAPVKILMPPEAQKVEKTLRDVGLGNVVDKAILSMNRAAEDASKEVGSIFWDAITQMSIEDAFGILRGGNHAATDFLKRKTSEKLTASFAPVINKSLEKTDATKYWKDVFSVYNRFSNQPVNTDLVAYVTDKALDGLFFNIGEEEKRIRQDPLARGSELLKKVFSNQ